MRKKLYTYTKKTIISARLSDNEMENVERLMEQNNMSASQLMRAAFLAMIERYTSQPEQLDTPGCN